MISHPLPPGDSPDRPSALTVLRSQHDALVRNRVSQPAGSVTGLLAHHATTEVAKAIKHLAALEQTAMSLDDMATWLSTQEACRESAAELIPLLRSLAATIWAGARS